MTSGCWHSPAPRTRRCCWPTGRYGWCRPARWGLDTPDKVIYTQADLIAEFGQEVTDVEAEMLAAGLTAKLA